MINAEKYKDKILEMKDDNYWFSIDKRDNQFKSCGESECSKCLINTRPNDESCRHAQMEWLLSDYKEPIKLSRLEYEILNHVQKEGFNFIARNDLSDYGGNLYGDLFIYEIKPIKPYSNVGWCTTCKSYVLYAFSDLFQFVKWEDEEPTSIKDVLDNCEVIENA